MLHPVNAANACVVYVCVRACMRAVCASTYLACTPSSTPMFALFAVLHGSWLICLATRTAIGDAVPWNAVQQWATMQDIPESSWRLSRRLPQPQNQCKVWGRGWTMRCLQGPETTAVGWRSGQSWWKGHRTPNAIYELLAKERAAPHCATHQGGTARSLQAKWLTAGKPKASLTSTGASEASCRRLRLRASSASRLTMTGSPGGDCVISSPCKSHRVCVHAAQHLMSI